MTDSPKTFSSWACMAGRQLCSVLVAPISDCYHATDFSENVICASCNVLDYIPTAGNFGCMPGASNISGSVPEFQSVLRKPWRAGAKQYQLLCTREGDRILVQPVRANRFWCMAATNVLIAVPVGANAFWCIAAPLPNGYSMKSEGLLNCERLGAES